MNKTIDQLIESVYGPTSTSRKSELQKCFTICQQAYGEFSEKSIEFNLAIMSERIESQMGVDYFEAYDVAVNFFISLSKEESEKLDEIAGKVKNALNLPDPMAKVERIANPRFDAWYHIRYYDPIVKQKLTCGFTLDGVDPNNEHLVEHVLINLPLGLKKHFDETKMKIASTIHPDCTVGGCQHAKDVGTFPEHVCNGKCHYINFV